MIYHVADDQKLAPYPAVRDVGGAFPQPAVHTPAVSHGAHRPRIHVAEGDDTTLRALRADSLPLHVAPVLFDFTPPSGRPFGIQVTRRQEGPDRGHGKRPASTQWGGGCTRKVVLAPGPSGEPVGPRACPLQRRRATSAPHARRVKPWYTPARVWPRNGLHLQRKDKS